jgi:hypothetical protein
MRSKPAQAATSKRRSFSICPLSSLIPRQLPASPMPVLPRRIKHPFDVTVQCPMRPMRANIVGPPNSATSISASIAGCHSAVAAFFFDSLVA